MRAAPDHRRLGFEHARNAEENLPPTLVVPTLHEVGQHPSGPFDPVQSFDDEPGFAHFPSQLLRPMEIGRGEVVQALSRILVTSIEEISVDDSSEILIAEEVAAQAIKRGSPP